MATASRHLCRSLVRISSRPPAKRRCQSVQQRLYTSPFRQLSSTAYHRAAPETSNRRPGRDADIEPQPEFTDKDLQTPAKPLTAADLDATERAHYETLPKSDQNQYLAVQNHMKAIMESSEMTSHSDDQARMIAKEIDRSGINPNFLEERDLNALKDGYWQEDEDDEFGQVPDDDDEWDESLITSVAESQLEVHREIREYTRIAAWELPGLLQFTKPFTLPDATTSPLRFRYTTYMGESHPAQSKVVLEFTTQELATASSLTQPQRTKLIKLLGVRYNPDTDAARMSCEQFENAAQNKRYLGDLVQNLVKEARDESDMFEDIPLDFRHHKPKVSHQFPEEWMVGNQDAVKRLARGREGMKVIEEGAAAGVDGKQVVEDYVRSQTLQPAFARAM